MHVRQSKRLRAERLEDRNAPAAGQLDPTFGVGGLVTTEYPLPSNDYGRATAIDSLGRIIVAGDSTNGPRPAFTVARYTPTGALDHWFGEAGVASFRFSIYDVTATAVAIDSQNRIVIAGYTTWGPNLDITLIRVTPAGILDATFDTDGIVVLDFGMSNDIANDVAIDSLDRIVVAGASDDNGIYDFAVSRLTAAGALDPTFDGDGKQTIAVGPNEDIAHGIVMDSLGRLVLAGEAQNPLARDFAVVRLAADGGLDNSFDGDGKHIFAFSAAYERANDVTVDPLNRVLVAGFDQGSGANSEMAVARLTAEGALDTNFDGDGKLTISVGSTEGVATGIAVDSMGRILIGGHANVGANNEFAVVRLTSSGALDVSFDGDGKQSFAFGTAANRGAELAIDSINRVLIVGYAMISGSQNDFAFARVTTTGALDNSFDSDGKQTLGFTYGSKAVGEAVTVDSVGRTVVAGWAENGTQGFMMIARYLASGALDTSFGVTGVVRFGFGSTGTLFAHANSVAVDSMDRVVVGGSWSGSSFAVARLTVGGALDTSFDSDGRQTVDFGAGDETARAVAVDTLNRIIVVGHWYDGNHERFAVARLTINGALDTSFDIDGRQTFAFGLSNDLALAVAVDSLDRIVMAGYTFFGSMHDFAAARLTVAGALDTTFDGDGMLRVDFGASDTAYGVTVDSQGRIVIVGQTGQNFSADFAIVRVLDSGEFDTTFDGDGKRTVDFGLTEDSATAVVVDSQDRIVVAGLTGDGSNTDFAVARVKESGALDPAFDADGKRTIAFSIGRDFANGVAVNAADQVFVAGSATLNVDVFAIARLTGDTTTATARVNDGSAQRSMVTSIRIAFSSVVTFNGSPTKAFTLTRNGGGAVSFSAVVQVINGGTVVTLGNFSGSETQFGSLRDGRYTLTAKASHIISDLGEELDGDANGQPGGNFIFGDGQGLFRYFGDVNGDRQVDGFDFGAFSSTYGLTTLQGGYLWYLDVNGDGRVDGFDFAQFIGRIFTFLP